MNWVLGVSPRHSSFDVSAVDSCALGFRVRHANRIAGNERRCFIVESNDDGVARFKRIREDAVEKVSSYAHDRGIGFGECLFELMGGDSDDGATLSIVLEGQDGRRPYILYWYGLRWPISSNGFHRSRALRHSVMALTVFWV